MADKFNWSVEIKQFVLSHYKGIGPTGMARLVSEKFNVKCTRSLMKGFYSRNHLNSGVTGYFPKNNVPHNKGQKGVIYPGSEKGWFKKGNKPHNTEKVGDEVVIKDGYIKVKIAEPNVWMLKHRLVWETHNGPIPKDMCIRFLDGNKQNCDINNLELITRAEHLQLTRSGHYTNNPEITKTGIVLAKVDIAIRQRKRSG